MKTITKITMLLLIVLFLIILVFAKNNICNNSKRLVEAIEDNDIGKISELISDNPEIINRLPSNMPKWWHRLTGIPNFYPIQVASQNGNYDVIEYLIESGADVNLKDSYIGTTPLILTLSSTSQNRFDIAFLLIENGADVNSSREDLERISVLSESIIIRETDSFETIEKGSLLFDYLFENIDKDKINWVEILMSSAYFGNYNAVNKILDSELAKINSADNLGRTALIRAVQGNQILIVKLLINEGASIEIVDNNGKTALDYAIKEGNNDIIDLIE